MPAFLKLKHFLMTAHHSNSALEQANRLFAAGQSREAEQLLRESRDDGACAAALRDYLLAEQRVPEALELARNSQEPIDRALLHHAAGEFEAAAALCRQVLEQVPEDPAALLHLARAIHNAGDQTGALAALRRAVDHRPDFAEGWAALAHALRASGDIASAIKAYEHALEQSPGLRQPRLDLGITLFNSDDAHGALACFEDLLARDPDDGDALVYSGLALQLLGNLSAARDRLEKAVAAAPQHPLAHRFLGAVCNELGDDARAVDHLKRARALTPDDPDIQAELADVHELSNRLDDMEQAVNRGLELAANHPQLLVQAARLVRRRGDPRQALQRLQAIDPNALPPRQAQQYFHEASLNLDRIGEADQAMEAMTVANQITANEPRAAGIDRNAAFERIERMRHWAEHWQPSSDDAPGWAGEGVCFLIGFPRSGTTLLDTMLDAHPDTASIEEKPTMEPVVERVRQRHGGYPEGIDRLGEPELAELSQRYRENLAEYLPDDRRPELIIDKMPLRILDAAFIRRLLPRATFILALRHPCDLIISNHMQLFEATDTLIHTTTLEGTVRLYEAVMTAWEAIAPTVADRLTRIRYEDLVADPEAELRRICEFLDLSWHPGLVDTQQRTRERGRIRTPSYQQVSEDIYQRAAGRWHRYRRHLEPYMQTLAPHAANLGYSIE
ncbi:sulfotransferase [Wenzhouxiangella sp. EGI_FJ10305]|uniref:sulfotransferase n=1 Tax=Wenzhouxiangella sp. EGI_FJ10305 TaxID=3243768 RepID=UPI0035DC88C7